MGHILAGAAVLGMAVITPVAAARWQARTERLAILARITLPQHVTAEMRAEAERLFAAEAAVRIAEAGLRLDIRIDQHGTYHYHAVDKCAPHASITHLVDTQPHSAVSATRPMLPAVTRGDLRPARLWDMGRAM